MNLRVDFGQAGGGWDLPVGDAQHDDYRLEQMIDPSTPNAPGRFQSVDNGIGWTLDPTVELVELERRLA